MGVVVGSAYARHWMLNRLAAYSKIRLPSNDPGVAVSSAYGVMGAMNALHEALWVP